MLTVNAQASKLTKEESAEKALENMTFGKNMADKKKIAKENKGGIDSAFTEEEIIEIARPDSVMNKYKKGFE